MIIQFMWHCEDLTIYYMKFGDLVNYPDRHDKHMKKFGFTISFKFNHYTCEFCFQNISSWRYILSYWSIFLFFFKHMCIFIIVKVLLLQFYLFLQQHNILINFSKGFLIPYFQLFLQSMQFGGELEHMDAIKMTFFKPSFLNQVIKSLMFYACNASQLLLKYVINQIPIMVKFLFT